MQVAILLLVAGMAGAASFTHVHDWTMANSPEGTGDWFGWANAVISELTPAAALLEIRRRRRYGRPAGYPLAVLIAAALLSITAQVSQATPSLAGWLVAALPALALLALIKMVISSRPVVLPTASVTSTAAESLPDVETGTSKKVKIKVIETPEAAAIQSSSPVDVELQPISAPQAAAVRPLVHSEPVAPLPTGLLERATQVAAAHRAATGQEVTGDVLRTELRVSGATAADILRALIPTPAGSHA